MGKKDGYTDEQFRAVAGAVRTLWMANRKIPTLEEIDAVCSETRGVIAKVIASDNFLTAMDITGVPFRKQKGLTAKQHYLLMILTEPTDKRSLSQRLKDARVSTTEYRAWLKNPIFKSFIEQFSERALGEHLSVAHNSLMNQVEKGNVRALEFYYEMTGRYNPRTQQERDITAVIAQVLEIIQRNVKDPEALANIAEEMRGLMGGGPGGNNGVGNNVGKKELPAYRSELVVDAEIVGEDRMGEDKMGEEASPVKAFNNERAEKYEVEGWDFETHNYDNPISLEEKLAQGGAVAGTEGKSFKFKDNFLDM